MFEKIEVEDDLNLVITDHAEKRYAERIMKRDEQYDITKYILDHKEDIKKNISKLVKYGTQIYSGKLREFPYGNIFINKNGWCIICDKDMNKAITLYKVDLGCSEKLNETYIEEMTELILSLIEDVDVAVLNRNVVNSEIRKSNQINKERISELQKEINNLNNMIKAGELLIDSNQWEVSALEREYRDKVECLTCTKIF